MQRHDSLDRSLRERESVEDTRYSQIMNDAVEDVKDRLDVEECADVAI